MTANGQADWKAGLAEEYHSRRAKLVSDRESFLKQSHRLKERAEATEAEIRRLDDGAAAFGLPVVAHPQEAGDGDASTAARGGPLFKDVALDLLKATYPQPLRAAEVQRRAESLLARKFHSKTTGMSLYRLSLDDFVERRGWDWFYVPDDERQQRQALRKRPEQQAEDLVDAMTQGPK